MKPRISVRWPALALLTTASLASATTPIGDYVAVGLGAQLSTAASTANDSSTSSATTTTSTGSTSLGSISIGGTGLAYAESCLSASSSYVLALTSWFSSEYLEYGTTATGTITPTVTFTGTQYAVETCVGVTSLTTLCDGHPRVVGSAQCNATGIEPFTITTVNTQPEYPSIPAYTMAFPNCTVAAADCEKLFSLNSNLVYVSSVSQSLCEFATATTSYTTNPTNGVVCNDCMLDASSAQLLYWPVRTVPGYGDLCNGTAKAKIIGGTPTGSGPNTFVTLGVTITSPSVAISLKSLFRQDGCFTTVKNTIIPVAPHEVTSVRGARALFTMEPFAYQDLNYKCQRGNSSEYTIQDFPGDDCYREVPASAYFGDHMAFDDWMQGFTGSLFTSMTIGNDYRPMLLPPVALTSWANSIFNTTGCMIQPDGVWDPPQALTLMSTEAGVTMDPVTTSTHVASSTSAVPAESAVAQPTQTTTSKSTTTTSHSETAADASHSQSEVFTSTSSMGSLAAVAGNIASWASFIGAGSTMEDPHTIVIATVVTISSQIYTQVSSNPSHVVVANAESTSTFTAGDPVLSTARVVYSIESQTYTEIVSETSFVVVGNLISTKTIAAVAQANTSVGHNSLPSSLGTIQGSPNVTVWTRQTLHIHTDDFTVVSTSSGAMAVRGRTTTIPISRGATAVTVEAELFQVTSGTLRSQPTTVTVVAPLESKESPTIASSTPGTFATTAVATPFTNSSDGGPKTNSHLRSMAFVMLGVMLLAYM